MAAIIAIVASVNETNLKDNGRAISSVSKDTGGGFCIAARRKKLSFAGFDFWVRSLELVMDHVLQS